MIKCVCGSEWKRQENLSAYEGEVVLVCDSCGARYFNAQDFFSDETLSSVEHVDNHKSR